MRPPVSLLATFKIVNIARIAQSETRGQNWIKRLFRGEKKPSKHRFNLQADQTYLFEVRLSEDCNSLRVKSKRHFTWYGVGNELEVGSYS